MEKILTDAKTLLESLPEHEGMAKWISLYLRVTVMCEAGTVLPDQYPEDAANAKDTAYYKPHQRSDAQ